MDTYQKVTNLLNDLRRKNQIDSWQYKKMLPDEKKMQLAYLYFMPKPHKVNVLFIGSNHSLSLSLSWIGRNTITSNCFIDPCTNHWYIKNVRSIDSTIIWWTCTTNNNSWWCSIYSSIRIVCSIRFVETNNTSMHMWCHWSLYNVTTRRINFNFNQISPSFQLLCYEKNVTSHVALFLGTMM